MVTQEIETFDDDVVHELPAEQDVVVDKSDDFETFDDDVILDIEPKQQLDQLEDEEDDGKKEAKEVEAEKKSDDEDKEEEDGKKEEKDGEQKKDEAPAPITKPVRLKDANGKTIDIDESMTLKTKVNGKNEFVTVKELRDSYAGKQNWSKLIEDAKHEKIKITEEVKAYEEDKKATIAHLTKIADMLDDDETSPLEALNYLVDISGRDALKFNKKVVDFLSSEVRALDEMDDIERELYWTKKENEYARNNQAAKLARESDLEAQREKVRAIEQMRESQGVTKEEYGQSSIELKSLGYKEDEITPEVIINYAVMKPHYEAAEKIAADFEEDLSDDEIEQLISTVANTMRSFPKISKEKALEVSLDSLGWEYGYEEEDFKELNAKAGSIGKIDDEDLEKYRYGKKKKEDEFESFDDFDDY